MMMVMTTKVMMVMTMMMTTMMMIMIMNMMQVHTILSPGDSLGLVIRGGAEYGVCCLLIT